MMSMPIDQDKRARETIYEDSGFDGWIQPNITNYVFLERGGQTYGEPAIQTGTYVSSAGSRQSYVRPSYRSDAEITSDMNKLEQSDQSWYWTPEWQAAEHEATQNLRDGDYEEFDSMDDFLATL